MNPTLIAALLAIAGIGGTTAIATDCHDLAGQGHLCAEASEEGANIDLYLEPTPPLEAALDCQDLAGQGHLCAEAGEDGADVELYLEPQPPARAARQDCQVIDGLGEVCADAGAESGSVSYDLENEALGLDAEGEIAYST